MNCDDRVLGQATGWTVQYLWFYCWQRQEVFSFAKYPDYLWSPPSLLFIEYPGAHLTSIKQLWNEGVTEVTNELSCTCSLSYALMAYKYTRTIYFIHTVFYTEHIFSNTTYALFSRVTSKNWQ
jgi:hypothetical protein